MLHANAAFSGYTVDSLERAKTFYSEILGLELSSEEMGLDFQLPGGGRLFLYEKADHRPATFTVLNFIVEDIDVAVEELLRQNVTMERYDSLPAAQEEKGILRGRSAGYGPDIAWFADPAGNILSVLQP